MINLGILLYKFLLFSECFRSNRQRFTSKWEQKGIIQRDKNGK